MWILSSSDVEFCSSTFTLQHSPRVMSFGRRWPVACCPGSATEQCGTTRYHDALPMNPQVRSYLETLVYVLLLTVLFYGFERFRPAEARQRLRDRVANYLYLPFVLA